MQPSAPGTCRAPRDHRTRLDREPFDTQGLDRPEITGEAFPPPTRTVFDQAENRLHTIEAVLVATLED
ncbi:MULTISPECIES: hypothetical protein [Streptomyces]|uniref:Ornithine carbamoyltransferase n=1 Tax=Streptomyces sp. NBC_00093 TaxID=2975649 RepID=A0AAU2AGD0_9ACTN